MKRASRAVGVFLCFSLLAPYAGAQAGGAAKPPAAQAQATLSESLTGMARAEYEAAKLLYADGDFAGASLKFERAYQESKDPRLLWNQAAAEKNLRRYVKVAELIERYVAESGDKLSEADRAEATSLLDTVKTFIAEVTFKVAPEGASVFVDDQQVGVSPLDKPVRVEMGERRISVKKAGFVEHTITRQFDGGAAASVEVTLQAEVHEGKLHVTASPGDTIRIDGKVVGTADWQGTLASGLHRVEVSAPGKRTYQSDVMVQDKQTSSLRVALEAEPSLMGPQKPAEEEGGGATWLWIGGGVLLAAGLGVGAYFLLKPEDETKKPLSGTLDPGFTELRF